MVAIGLHQQLAFPGWNGPLTLVHSERLRGETDVQLQIRTGYREFHLELEVVSKHQPGDFWHRNGTFVIAIQLADTPRCLVNGEPHWWNLLADDEDDGPFSSALTWALEHLEPDIWNCDTGSERYDRSGRIIQHASRVVAGWAGQASDGSARHSALAFPPSARMFVYAAIVADGTGRVRQMTGICPGLLVLISEREPFARRVLAGIQAGRALRVLLDEATEDCGLRPRHRDAAAFVRRAPAVISHSLLWATICAQGVDINDMPHVRDELITWYEWQGESARVEWRFFPEERRRFGSFVSKHALALEALSRRRTSDRATLLAEIVDWVRSGEATPSRTASPARVLADVDAWHAGLWGYGGPNTDVALPDAPMANEDLADFCIEPIRSLRELYEEGRAMHHCVGSYSQAALSGRVHFYRARLGSERLTIAIRWSGERWRLLEASGFANRRPSRLGTIQRWIELLHPLNGRATRG